MSTMEQSGKQGTISAALKVLTRFPVPMLLALVNTVWLILVVTDTAFDFGLRLNYGLHLGLLTSFFVTLGLARLGERAPHLNRRMLILAILAPFPLTFLSLVLMSVDLATSLGLLLADTHQLQRAIANTMSIHLVAAGVCAAFVLPYAVGKIGNARFVHWTLRSIIGGLVGLVIAGLLQTALTFLALAFDAVAFRLPPEIRFVIWIVCLSLVWPWYALSELPFIGPAARSGITPVSKFFRIISAWIALPFWVTGAVLLGIWLAGELADGGPFELLHVTFLGGCSAFSLICYMLAIRQAADSRVMAFWARWMGLVILAVSLVALFMLFEGVRGRGGIYIQAFLAVTFVWLTLFSLYVIIRREPDYPRIAGSFVLAMLLGIVVAAPTTNYFDARKPDTGLQGPTSKWIKHDWQSVERLILMTDQVWVHTGDNVFLTGRKDSVSLSFDVDRLQRSESIWPLILEQKQGVLSVRLGKSCLLGQIGFDEFAAAHRANKRAPLSVRAGDLEVRLFVRSLRYRQVSDGTITNVGLSVRLIIVHIASLQDLLNPTCLEE